MAGSGKPNLPISSAVKRIEAELYFRCDADLGEGPVWEAGTLFWTDITGKVIYAKPDGADAAKKYPTGTQVGAFALWDERRMILATEQGFCCMDLHSGQVIPWINPEPNLVDNRFNDGKCDPCGRFVAGTMNRKGVPLRGALYSLEKNRSTRRIYRPVSCSNGLAWSATGDRMYYIDTPTAVVKSFHYDLGTGDISDESVIIEIPPSHGHPDGMTIDRDGNLWIALWNGWGVECWSPVSGKCLARVEVPVSCVTSCVFGGSHYDTLFITTARNGLTVPGLAAQDTAGSIFYANPGVCGYGAVHFRQGLP